MHMRTNGNKHRCFELLRLGYYGFLHCCVAFVVVGKCVGILAVVLWIFLSVLGGCA